MRVLVPSHQSRCVVLASMIVVAGILFGRPASAEPAFVGLMVQGVELTIARALGMASPRGVLVSAIDESKSAPQGLAADDLIVQVNQKDVWLPQQVADAVGGSAADGADELLLTVEGPRGFRFALLPRSGSPAYPTGGDIANLPAAGVQLETMTSAAAAALGLGESRGVLVRDVVPGSPAAAAGLRRGDLIVEASGDAVDTADTVARGIRSAQAGSTFEVAIVGPDGRSTRQLTVPKPVAATPKRESFANLPNAGVTVAVVTAEARQSFGLRWASEGVVVTLVQTAAAGETDLRRGDLIFQIDQNDVRTPDDVVDAYARAKAAGRKNVLLTVEGVGGYRFSLLSVN